MDLKSDFNDAMTKMTRFQGERMKVLLTCASCYFGKNRSLSAYSQAKAVKGIFLGAKIFALPKNTTFADQ